MNDVEDHIALARVALPKPGLLFWCLLSAHAGRYLQGKRVCQHSGDDTQEHAQQHLDTSVAEEFAELMLGESMGLEQFVHDLVHETGLLTGRPANALGVDHHNGSKAKGHGKDRAPEAAGNTNRRGHGADRRGMGAWHSPKPEHEGRIVLMCLDEVDKEFDELGYEPSGKTCPYSDVLVPELRLGYHGGMYLPIWRRLVQPVQ
jgi:hypothetical protein